MREKQNKIKLSWSWRVTGEGVGIVYFTQDGGEETMSKRRVMRHVNNPGEQW